MRDKRNQISWKLSKLILIVTFLAVVVVGIPGIQLFSNRIEMDSLQSKERLMQEIMNQLDYRVDTIRRECNRIKKEGELLLLIQQYYDKEIEESAVNLKLNTLLTPIGEYVNSIVIETADGTSFTSITGVRGKEYQSLAEYLEGREYYLFRPDYYQDSYGRERGEISYMTRMELRNGEEALIILEINLNILRNVFDAFENESERYVWLGYDNEEISPLESMYTEEELEPIYRECNKFYLNYHTRIENSSGYTLIRYSENCGWKLAADVSGKKLLENYQWVFVYYFLALLLTGAVTIVCMLPLLRIQIKPLRDLSKHMNRITQNSWEEVGEFVCDRTNDEVMELKESFNYMVRELENDKIRMLEHEKEKERMRYSLLISQVNPHFIYNTLNIMTYLVRQGRSNEIIRVNQALIRILKDTLRIDEIQIYDTTWHELKIVEQYILIEKYRYGDFVYEAELEPAVRELEIPKNIIQPLVENALFHGIVPIMEDGVVGRIKVQAAMAGEHIVIRVTDNGTGMEQQQLKNLQKVAKFGEKGSAEVDERKRGHHIGIKNIVGRVHYLYGDLEGESRLQIESSPDKGTCVTVILDKVEKMGSEKSNENKQRMS